MKHLNTLKMMKIRGWTCSCCLKGKHVLDGGAVFLLTVLCAFYTILTAGFDIHGNLPLKVCVCYRFGGQSDSQITISIVSSGHSFLPREVAVCNCVRRHDVFRNVDLDCILPVVHAIISW